MGSPVSLSRGKLTSIPPLPVMEWTRVVELRRPRNGLETEGLGKLSNQSSAPAVPRKRTPPLCNIQKHNLPFSMLLDCKTNPSNWNCSANR